MKELSRRNFLKGAGMTIGAGILAACGATPAPTQGAAAPTAAKASEPTATVAPVKSGEKTAVMYWQYMTDMEKVETPILEAFKKANADIDMTWQYIPWQQYWEKLNATLAAGNPPDVWNTAPTFFFEYILRKQLVDLSDLLKRDIKMDDFYATSLSGYDLNGKYYGAPRNIVTTVVFFNSDMFEKAGVATPPLDGNWTWQDYLDKASAITNNLKTSDKIIDWGGQAFQSGQWLDQVIASNGGKAFKGEFRRDLVGMEANYDDSIACDTFSFQNDMINKQKVAPPAGEFEGQGDSFLTGRLAMAFNGNWALVNYKDAKFKWDVTMLPKGSAKQITYGGADGLVISQATKAVEASWKLVLWLADPKTGGDFLGSSGMMPVTKSVANSDQYLGKWPDKNMQTFLKSAETCENTFTLGFNEWKKSMNDELQKMFLGQVPASEACTNIDKAVDTAFDTIRKQFQEVLK